MPQLAASRQSPPPPVHALDVLTAEERAIARQRLEEAFYPFVRPVGGPEFKRLSTAQRRLIANALDIAKRSVDPSRLHEGVF